jgi:protein TonB
VATPQVARRAPTSELSPFESRPNFVYQPKPAYPLIAKRRGWEGTVTLDIELRADGSVGDIKVAQSSGYPLLDEAALDQVKTWRHIPVKRDGVPVTRRAHQPLVFKLD